MPKPHPIVTGAAKAHGPADTAALLHELHVHQVELETQNEELRRTQIDLAAARDRYVDLFDFAPVGYVTIDADGVIVEANLTAATMLGVERGRLLQRRFGHYVDADSADPWHRHAMQAWKHGAAQRIELALRPRDAEPFQAQLDSVRMGVGTPVLRVAFSDISGRRLAELTRQIAVAALATQEAERGRVARSLHEELGQRLSVLKMELSRFGGAGPAASRQRVDAMLRMVDEALCTVRRCSTELGPPMLRDLGLHAAVDWLVRDTERRCGRHIDVALPDGEPALDEGTAISLYRLVQEMLAPLVHGGEPAPLRFQMRREADALTLSLEHAGTEPPTRAGAAGHGRWVSLRDRAHLLGAAVDLRTVAPGRSRLSVRLPLAAPAVPPQPSQTDSRGGLP